MTVRSGLIALSGLALASLTMLGGSADEAYRWVEQSPTSAIVTAIIAALGLMAAFMERISLALAAEAAALVAAFVQFVGISNDGGVLGGNGSTFAFFLALGIGYAGLAYAWMLERGTE